MNFKNTLMKKVSLFMAIALMISSNGITANAQTSIDEADAAYGWSESIEDVRMSTYAGEPVWTLRDSKIVTLDANEMTLNSYTMVLLNDTKLCKGSTIHRGMFYGYVRARFETVFGEVITGSDSGKVHSYYGSTAVTPDSDMVGWNGIAHTYCGTAKE